MAESIVVSSVEWLGSLLIRETTTLIGVEDEVAKLKQTLEFLQEYLRDADAKSQSHSAEPVRVLTAQAKKLAYDAEDLIDTYILQVTPKTQLSDRNWLVKSARFAYKAPRAYKLGKLIQELKKNANEVTDKLDKQEVKRTSHVEETTSFSQKLPRTSYPYEEGEFVVGWEKDIQKLVEILMGQGKNHEVHVVSIMGMGGSGKTTLARKLYNHPYVKECFNCWAWVFISQEWSTQHVLLEILRQVVGPGCQHDINSHASKEELVDKLRSILKKKSYLVVLDDVWRRTVLQDIFPALPYSRGSKIIITTRNQEIVQFKMPQSSYIYEPPPLDEDQGWKLLSKFALNHCPDSSQLDMQSFEQLGKKMVRQCDGLPLAIVSLAGILSTKTTIGEWQQVSDAVLTRVMEGTCMHMSDKVEHILAISYDDLPHYLKPCFLHLAVFPEDCRIPAGILTRMWIAEGLVIAHKELSVEEVATKFLEELSHRFMIQVVKTNFKKEIKAVRLHDLLRDFCITKSRQEGFLEIYSEELATSSVSPVATQSRRAALHSSTALPAQAHLRSLVVLTRSSILHSAYVSKEMFGLDVVCRNFKLLRVLSLWGIKTASGTLPKQIGRLVHLRYLGIRATNITELPISIGGLRNLLTLDFRNVDSDNRNVPIKIPNILFKLVLLRHLFLPIDCPWNVTELKLSTMKNLQSLWGLKQEVGEAHWLSKEVPMLSTTLKKLRVIVSTEEDMRAIFSCPSLMSDGRLRTFHCELGNCIALQQQVIVNHLSGHQHLHKLILIGNICMELSFLLPANLIRLELKDSMLKYGDPMSALGALAHLRLLKLSNFYMGSSFTCKLGSFPKLEELYLENLQNLDTWRIEQGAMPCLKKLEIVACWKLRDFPQGMVFITTLQQLEFSGMPKEFVQKAKEYGWSSKKLRLPHNCEAIIKQCDSPVDTSSISKIYEQLAAGVFLNNKKQKYWVMNQDDSYNCFMVYASDLFVHQFSKATKESRIQEIYNGDGTSITAIEVQTSVAGLEVGGKFNTVNLSLEVTYEIAWVIKIESEVRKILVDEVEMRDVNPEIYTRLILPDGSIVSHQQTPIHHHFILVPAGKFETSPDIIGDIELSLSFCVDRNPCKVRIGGFLIKPSLNPPCAGRNLWCPMIWK